MSYFLVKNKKYQSYKKILKIAEIGCNHNNDFNLCKKLINLSKQAGFDAVKFQLFQADQLVPKNTKGYKILKKFELSERWIKKISDYCKKKKILFACSPFSHESIDILVKYKCDILKIASPEIKNLPLIKYASSKKIPLIISTGDSSMEIVYDAKKILHKKNYKHNAFLHCVSQYPTEINNLNLLNIKYLKNKLKKYEIGFSDHSMGIDACVNAVSLGASIIEKHITLSRKNSGPDHFFAIEPKEFFKMIKMINNYLVSLGKEKKERLKEENTVYIKTFAKQNINKGEKINRSNVKFLRSLKKKGIDCKNFNKLLGKKIKKDLSCDDLITESNLH